MRGMLARRIAISIGIVFIVATSTKFGPHGVMVAAIIFIAVLAGFTFRKKMSIW